MNVCEYNFRGRACVILNLTSIDMKFQAVSAVLWHDILQFI